jgi:glutathione S-transferase
MRKIAFILLLLVPVSGFSAGMTLEQVAQLRQVSGASISPDGRHVAYTLSVPRTLFEDKDGPAWNELHVTGADGQSRPFVAGERYSVADITALVAIDFMKPAKLVMPEEYAALRHWHERVAARPSITGVSAL